MPLTDVTATIPAGESLSNEIDASAGKVIRIIMPAAWTPANLSFQIADLGTGPFNDVFTRDGGEFLMACTPGKVYAIGTSEWASEGFIKVRSGSAQAPIVQDAARAFTFVVLR
jgi:hypothetical protein